MTPTPAPIRVVVFIDAQNLYHAVKQAFGYTYPNYDVVALCNHICKSKGWQLVQIRFYTGVPDESDSPEWNHFWTHKLAHMGRNQVWVFSRPLRYQNRVVYLPDGSQHTVLVGQEKGVDVRMALDIVSLAHERQYDAALIMSQDQDLTEAVEDVKKVAQSHGRPVRMVCAFPSSPAYANKRGIDKTDWIKIDRPMYDRCLDKRDYRPKKKIETGGPRPPHKRRTELKNDKSPKKLTLATAKFFSNQKTFKKAGPPAGPSKTQKLNRGRRGR